MRLSFLREQLVRSSEQFVLVNTKRVFLGPGTFWLTVTPAHLAGNYFQAVKVAFIYTSCYMTSDGEKNLE